MFCLASLSEGNSINLKCEPDKAIALREAHDCVQPGWHMNKKMWNTVMLDNSVRKNTIFEWIDHSYEEVIKKLPKKDLLALRSGK